MKFKIGDYVKILDDSVLWGNQTIFFMTIGIIVACDHDYTYKIDNNLGKRWFRENMIEDAGPYGQYHFIAREICGASK